MGGGFKPVRAVAAAVVLLACGPALAQEDRAARCLDRTDPDKAISACSSLIWKVEMTSIGAAMVHTSRGEAYEDKGDFHGAFRDYRQAMTYYRWYARAYHARSRLYIRTRDFPRALRDAESAIKLDAKDAVAHDLRALSLAEMGRTAESRADAAAAATLAGDNPFTNNTRCWLRALLNRDLTAALAACDAAIAKAPNGARYDSRAFVHFRLGDMANAMADYNAALALAPRSASSLFMRGVIKRRGGDTVGGDGDIAAAKTINPNVAIEYGLYGVVP